MAPIYFSMYLKRWNRTNAGLQLVQLVTVRNISVAILTFKLGQFYINKKLLQKGRH